MACSHLVPLAQCWSNRTSSEAFGFSEFPRVTSRVKKPQTSVNLIFGLNFHFEVGEAHHRALEIISVVGCSVSLIAVLVTIAVSLMFWRAIKSPRAKVILNLCIAIALSCIFVITEGFARENKVLVYCYKRLRH